jgi:hypothetical protein
MTLSRRPRKSRKSNALGLENDIKIAQQRETEKIDYKTHHRAAQSPGCSQLPMQYAVRKA